MSVASDAADEIRGVVRRELAACEAALAEIADNDHAEIAISELEAAVRKLKRIANDLD
jgi:hypothetical protein